MIVSEIKPIRILSICIMLLGYAIPSWAQQPQMVAPPEDAQQNSNAKTDIQTDFNLENQPADINPELVNPLSEQGTLLEALPDSASIMSQAEYLLEQMHAGTLLYPSYQKDANSEGKSNSRKFSHGLIAGAQREELIGLMGIEHGMLGYGISYGPLSLQAYATADKYGSFRNLTTVFGVGGSITMEVTDWMSVTAFGAYYNKAPYMGMAAYPYINTSNYGGYMTLKPTDKFGMSLGVRRDYDPVSGRYYTNPILAPSLKVNKAVLSIDFGPLVNEVFELFNRPKMPSGPMIGPPGPRLLKPAGPLR